MNSNANTINNNTTMTKPITNKLDTKVTTGLKLSKTSTSTGTNNLFDFNSIKNKV